MSARTAGPLGVLASRVGGWTRLALLVLALGAVGAGLLWQRQQHAPVPPGAQQVSTSLVAA